MHVQEAYVCLSAAFMCGCMLAHFTVWAAEEVLCHFQQLSWTHCVGVWSDMAAIKLSQWKTDAVALTAPVLDRIPSIPWQTFGGSLNACVIAQWLPGIHCRGPASSIWLCARERRKKKIKACMFSVFRCRYVLWKWFVLQRVSVLRCLRSKGTERQMEAHRRHLSPHCFQRPHEASQSFTGSQSACHSHSRCFHTDWFTTYYGHCIIHTYATRISLSGPRTNTCTYTSTHT